MCTARLGGVLALVIVLVLVVSAGSGIALGEEIDNDTCMSCHNPDLLELSPEERLEQVEVPETPLPPRLELPFRMGMWSLAIDLEKYNRSAHGEMACTECHQDVEEIPHLQRLQGVNCAQCHDVEAFRVSAHGNPAAGKGPPCVGCHDVHYGRSGEAQRVFWDQRACLECHRAYGMDNRRAHLVLPGGDLHLRALRCMVCHGDEEARVHAIPTVEAYVAGCESCHSRYTILEDRRPKDVSPLRTRFINEGSLGEVGYVVGAHRIPLLDTVLIFLVVAPLGLPVIHGGLRYLTREKRRYHIRVEEEVLLHPFLERLWHWCQAVCFLILILTGAMIHWPERFPGWFPGAVSVHNAFGWIVVFCYLFWLLYNVVTGRISHYLPRKGEYPSGMIRQARFYLHGIFRHEPHPYVPSEDNKFNPLQKLAYVLFQAMLLPLLIMSGLLYMYPDSFQGAIGVIGGIRVVGIIHLTLAALFTSFLVAHLYLATTGETVGENFRAIIFGYAPKGRPEGEAGESSGSAGA